MKLNASRDSEADEIPLENPCGQARSNNNTAAKSATAALRLSRLTFASALSGAPLRIRNVTTKPAVSTVAQNAV